MIPIKKQLNLFTAHGSCKIENGSRRFKQNQEKTALWKPQNNVRPVENGTYDENQIKDIKSAIKPNLNFCTSKIQVKLMVKYDKFYETYNVSFNIIMDKGFVNKLQTSLKSPKLLLSCSVSCKDSDGDSKEWRLENGYESKLKLSIPDVAIMEHQVIEDYKHASDMAACCKISGESITLSFDWGIMLEWEVVNFKIESSELNVLEKMFSQNKLKDCCLVATDGSEVFCHRTILAVHSDILMKNFTTAHQASIQKIQMPELSKNGINVFLHYLYTHKINTDGLKDGVALEILQAAQAYDIPHLERAVLELLFYKPNDWYSLNNALALYFITVNKEKYKALCDKSMDILKRNFETLRTSKPFKELVAKHPKEGLELTQKLGNINDLGKLITDILPAS